ncbi:unnamed protein product [Rhizophagus irregularis]|nr:unnamed protein product [Rhizophagus irregularis]
MSFVTQNSIGPVGNEIIDNFIQEKQSKYKCGVVFEWIPYDKFIEIEKIEESDFATGIWKEGSLRYNEYEKEWIRTSYEKVILRFLSNSENITDEFINKIKSYLLNNSYSNYGISQNPDTRNYILVFNNNYFYYCKRCGEQYKYIRDDYENHYRYKIDEDHKWCKSCHVNYLKNNFTNWTSGNEIIDNFIQMKQLNIKTSYDLIFDWIPYNELVEIKEIGKVVLKYLSDSQNITDESLNEASASIDGYGISQNPNTKDYILVVHNKYYNKYCKECDKEYTKLNHKCCESCLIKYLGSNLINWTSGNEKIDDFIRKRQLKTSIESSNIFEWIPYNKFIEIKKKWMRTSSKKVFLKYLCYSQNVTDEFINKIESYLTNKMDYGVSQNYILVFNSEYFDYYCVKCGNEYEKWCKLCQINHLKDNFTNWTSGNEKIDSFIQKNQLKINEYKDTIFEWIPYNKFIEINETEKGGFFTAIWKDDGSQNINNKFLNEIIYLVEESYGISQDPNTNDFIWFFNLNIIVKIVEMKLNVDYLYSNVIFEWIPYNQFDDIKEIGKGGFSTVYSAIWKNGLFDSKDKIRIPNTKAIFLKIYGISQNPNTNDYIMVFEYAEGGNFNNYLNKNHEKFDWFNGLNVLNNIAISLNGIHQKQMVHRDFHTGNILFMNNNLAARISDMGLSPEVLKGKPYTQAADIYSLWYDYCWDGNPGNRPNSIEINEMIELFYYSLNQILTRTKQRCSTVEITDFTNL